MRLTEGIVVDSVLTFESCVFRITPRSTEAK